MNGEKRDFAPPMTGGSSLLVIFSVLCLTVFALLALSTAQADGRLGEAASEAVKNYYRADTEAQTVLARLRSGEVPEGVTLTEKTAADRAAADETATGTADGSAANGVSTNGASQTDEKVITAAWTCRISDTQALEAEADFFGGLGDSYRITRWQSVSTAAWEPDDSLPVWDGEFGE